MHAKFTDMHRNFMGRDQIFSAAGMKRLRGRNSNVLPQHNVLLLQFIPIGIQACGSQVRLDLRKYQNSSKVNVSIYYKSLSRICLERRKISP